MSEYIIKETGYPEAYELEVVQELVRCRDCEYWKHHSAVLDNDYCELTSTACEEDHFCSWGEKKDER